MTDAKLQNNRYLAIAIDIGIVIVLSIVLAILGVIFSLIASFLGKIIYVLLSLFVCGFILLRDFLYKGNSIGKTIMKVKVVTESGGTISVIHSIKRNLIFAIPAFISFLASIFGLIPVVGAIISTVLSILNILIGLAAFAFGIYELYLIYKDHDGVRWGDKFASTKVISL